MKKPKKVSAVSRRRFIQIAAGGPALVFLASKTSLARVTPRSAPPVQSAATAFELDEISIADIQQGFKSGEYTTQSLVNLYRQRMNQIDKNGPGLNSIIEWNPDADAIAETLDRERKSGKARGPLHGIPILIKDNIDTADKMETTAGSLALLGSKPSRDAFIVERLRSAGAVIIGKTNLSEWANFRSTHSSSGWSGRGGQTHNPYEIDRNPCGSSSGSGAAVAANLCAVAVGTETDGSIVCPSGANGIVGIKPTLGVVSRSGIIPIAHSQDTAGPMARTVTDAAILLGVLARLDPKDPAALAARGQIQTDYTRFLNAAALKGARIGVARKFAGFNDKVDALLNDAIDVLKKHGAEVIDPADLATSGKFDDSEFEVLLYEFKADLNTYLATRGAAVKSLKDIIEFNNRNRDREMPYFGQEIMIRAEAKGPLTEKAYIEALDKNHKMSRAEGIDEVMNRLKLDAIISPTGSPAWTTDLVNGDHSVGGSSTPAAVAGYPNINVPAGFVFGLPVGISFFGRAFSEPKLIVLAFAYEQATKHRRPPSFAAQGPRG
jgi:amidase